MGKRIYTPAKSILSKHTHGFSDSYVKDGVYKFMGCSVLSINMSLGFNGTASSVSVTLIEDTINGDVFIPPIIPSMWAISLPKGGIGQPALVVDGTILHPDGFYPTNVPFYFAGICTTWRKNAIDTGGRTITVTLSDPREILGGVQCILSGFSLSREVGVGARYLDVTNVIDVFGYWDNGMESDRNDYGMQWTKILEVLQNVRVTLHDMNFEFFFNGRPFADTPDWYRIDEQIIDINGLCQKVSEDAGADFVVIGRKSSINDMVLEVRSIERNKVNPLGRVELAGFVNARKDIVESANLGQEFKNEPTSSIIVGGMQNSNYLALPTEYDTTMHIKDGYEDYNMFPADIKVRLFGGRGDITQEDTESGDVKPARRMFKIKSGAILPFWGFTPDDNAYPLVEPFLPLEHLAFDRESQNVAGLTIRIPSCKIMINNFSVRNVKHKDVFLTGDGEPDERPFAFIDNYKVNAVMESGYIRGMPLNTEVLRAAIISEQAFYSLYSLYYPDVADALGFPRPDWQAIDKATRPQKGKPDLASLPIEEYISKPITVNNIAHNLTRDNVGRVPKSQWDAVSKENKLMGILNRFRTIIYEQVRQYAVDHMGRKFIVVLPRSAIMERLWLNLPVPTEPDRPEIEYRVADRGYWDTVPAEFDGIVRRNENSTVSQEEEIRRRFMAEDGRFYPMAVIDWKPSGNINFNSNRINRAMFQDIPASEFRPNRIAEGNLDYIFCSCSINQLVKRPDLALVELPAAISFDPTVGISYFNKYKDGSMDDEFIATKTGIMNYLVYLFKKDNMFRAVIKRVAQARGEAPYPYAMKVFAAWANRLYMNKNLFYQAEFSTELVMDLKGVVVPLTSNWMAYGPFYATYEQAKGMVKIEVDESLVPWNFFTPFDVDPNAAETSGTLEEAGQERLSRSLSSVDAIDNATITTAGFPEFGPAQRFGSNSNLTGITVDFGVGGVKTTYNFSTYASRPGTYRKSEYDNVSKARTDIREKLPDTINENIVNTVFAPNERNRFQN
jgi:hypothetical protein